jgi:hypothetical protein
MCTCRPALRSLSYIAAGFRDVARARLCGQASQRAQALLHECLL